MFTNIASIVATIGIGQGLAIAVGLIGLGAGITYIFTRRRDMVSGIGNFVRKSRVPFNRNREAVLTDPNS